MKKVLVGINFLLGRVFLFLFLKESLMKRSVFSLKRIAVFGVAVLLGLGAVINLPAEATAETRTLEALLKHSSPRWYQTRKASGHPVGCGPAAWAIVYGYYAQYKNMPGLFEGNIGGHLTQTGREDPFVKPVMEEIARYTESTYGTYQGQGWGRTLGGNMCKGLKYARKRGFYTRCFRIRGSEFNKAHHAMEWIKEGKPGILITNDPRKAFSTLHYPVVEGVRIKQKRVNGKWKDRDVDYWVNRGGGGANEWINVRQFGRDTRHRSGSFSLFLFDISKTKLPNAHGDINLAHCIDYCRRTPDCEKCAKTAGCGAGYTKMRSWKEAGKNYYACKKRTSRAEESRSNKEACQRWCDQSSSCSKCSRKVGCGAGYKKIKSWTGRGDNWYACQER